MEDFSVCSCPSEAPELELGASEPHTALEEHPRATGKVSAPHPHGLGCCSGRQAAASPSSAQRSVMPSTARGCGLPRGPVFTGGLPEGHAGVLGQERAHLPLGLAELGKQTLDGDGGDRGCPGEGQVRCGVLRRCRERSCRGAVSPPGGGIHA